MRDSTDPQYQSDVLEQSSEIETIIAEIKMILFTKQGDVLGSYNFGYNLEDNLFLFNLNASELRNQLLNQISQFCPTAFNYGLDLDVSFYQGTTRDICLIDIYLNKQKVTGILIS